MKKIFTLSLLVVALVAQAKVYTLADLAAIEGSGVEFNEGVYTVSINTSLTEAQDLDNGGISVSKTDLIINVGNGLTISEGETLLFTGKARVTVNGPLVIDGATVGADEASTGTAQGFRSYNSDASVTITNSTFDYIGFTFGCDGGNGTFQADNCDFNFHNGKNSNAAVTFSHTNDGNVVNNCRFIDNTLSSLASGSNTPVGITISNCTFNKSITSTRVYPAINMTCGGLAYDIIIENNVVTGPFQTTRGGGISIGHLTGGTATGNIYVRNNKVSGCSYGIALTGQGNIFIEDNQVIDNNFIADPNQGGSGINITNSSGGTKAYIKGNFVKGNSWGMTIIGDNDVNIGKTEDPNAEDYNPGENVFIDNGNNGTLYDLYNNGPATVYAQGNCWNVEVQDAEHIEQVIYHKVDNENLGEVIFMPAQVLKVLTGKVNDSETSEGIEGVKVTLTVSVDTPAGMRRAESTNYTATTDANGEYNLTFTPVENANYTLTFEKDGYATTTIENASVDEPVDVTLEKDQLDAISDISSAAVVSVKYVNTMGQISDKPFEGINIVITRNADGTTKTTKIVK